MRSKHIIALAAFFTCFGLSALLVGLFFDADTIDPELYKIVSVRPPADTATSGKILALLRQDIENGGRHADEYGLYNGEEDFPTLAAKSEIISEYTQKSGSIDDSGLPKDFQIVWRKHMKAWADYSNFLEKAERAGMDLDDIKSLDDQYTDDIDSSWWEVLRVGRSYGANPFR